MTKVTPSYTQTNWSLEDLFTAGGDALEQAFKDLEGKTASFEEARSRLSENIPTDEFLSIVRELEQIHYQVRTLYAYAELRFSENTQDQDALSLLARVEQFGAELENRTLFFTIWWKDLPDEAAQRLMDDAGDVRYWLEEMRHFKPHMLSEAEEKIINLKNVTGSSALNTLYDSMTNRYTFTITVEGEEKELTRGELMVYARSADPELRSAAYQELYRVYADDGGLLGQIYQTLVRDWRNEQIGLRSFASPISARNLANDIPDDVVNTLLDVCRKNAPLFQRYFKLKARWLGMERLRRYDVYAPIAQSEKNYAFDQAAQMVFDSFDSFDPNLAGMAERVFTENHLDSEVRKGKRGGAFCLTAVPDVTPWVLVNYQGRTEDVSTLAHELGHAIHAMLAQHHSVLTFHASLPLAETASTFSEMMLVERMLSQETDESVRRDLLFSQVDDAYATILRQSYFAIFEREAHRLIKEGASVDQLAEAYLHNLKEQFGDSVEVSDEFRWEWVSIPHIFHVPFYVYAYTFGQLLVLALYKQYQEEGEAFKPRYIKVLSAGGSDAPARVLAEAGIDISQESFWQGGFDVVEGLIRKLEELPVQ
jgi:oligoendopeptidase F